VSFFAELPAQAKALIGGLFLLVVILGGMAFLPRGNAAGGEAAVPGQTAPGYTIIYTEMKSEDLRLASEELERAGIPFRVGINGTSLSVVNDKADDAKVKLALKGLPKDAEIGFSQLFGDKPNSFISTDFEKKVAFNRALNGELSRLLKKIDGVQAASVIVNMPEDQLFSEERKPTTASVMIKQDPTKKLLKQQVEGVQHLVASSVPGLKTNNVTVVSDTGTLLSDGMTENAGDVEDRMVAKALDRQMMLTRERENAIESKVQSLLDKIFGPGKTVVRVAVDLDFTQKKTKTRLFAPPADGTGRQAPTTTSKVTEVSRNGTPGGAPGTTSNIPRVQTYPITNTGNGDATYERTAESTNNTTYSMNDTITEEEVGTIKRLSVTALIQGLPAERVPAMAEIVASTAGADRAGRGDQVVVMPMAFDASQNDMLKQLLEQQDEAKKATTSKKAEGGIPLSWIIGAGAAFLFLSLVLVLLRLSNRKEDTTDVLVETLGGDGNFPQNFDPNALGSYGPEMTGTVPQMGEESAFGFLEQIDPEMVADLLSQERPNMSAGVLAQLNPGFADMVLSVMPPDMQEDLINRLQANPQLPAFQAKQVASNLRRRLQVPA
jgi:flagellar M-ring protein FliF